jgi:4-carboxymuconolactone decarboxylase
MLGAALEVGVTPVEAKEIVYHAVPYVGQGRAFDVLHATNDVLTARGVALPLPGQATTTPSTRRDAGLALRRQIFGTDTTDSAYAAAPTDQAHIQDFLSGNCFGDHWTRTGLDIPTRELLTFALLTALGGCEAQLRGHTRGNANVGNGRTVLVATITQLVPWIGYPRCLNALAVVNEVLPGGQ